MQEETIYLGDLLGAARWRLRRDPVLAFPEAPESIPVSILRDVLGGLAAQYDRDRDYQVYGLIFAAAHTSRPSAAQAVDAVLAAWVCDHKHMEDRGKRLPEQTDDGAVVLPFVGVTPMAKLLASRDLDHAQGALRTVAECPEYLESLWSMVRALLFTLRMCCEGRRCPFSYGWTAYWVAPCTARRDSLVMRRIREGRSYLHAATARDTVCMPIPDDRYNERDRDVEDDIDPDFDADGSSDLEEAASQAGG